MKIGVIGCAGRMGRALVRATLSDPELELSGGIVRADSEFIGYDIAEFAGESSIGATISDNIEELVQASDAVIDFTSPSTTIEVLRHTTTNPTVHIIGTTGMNAQEKNIVQQAAQNAVIVQSHNMSIGVNLLNTLVRKVAAALPANMYDIEISEMHHRNKVDAPSGTALMLGEAAAEGRDVALEDVARYERSGIVGARPEGEIGFSTLRGGDVIGDHTVMFASDFERIELTHKALTRDVFAAGALRAAKWAHEKPAGLYSMEDVLEL